MVEHEHEKLLNVSLERDGAGWLARHGDTVVWRASASTANPAMEPADAVVAAQLVPFMRRGMPMHLEQPVSPLLLSAMTKLQGILTRWHRPSRRVEVVGVGSPPARTPASGVGCFFTASVAAWDCLLRHHDELTHLVWLDGFGHAVRRGEAQAFERLARAQGKIPIVVRLESKKPDGVRWELYHGSLLASAALYLSDELGKVYVPAAHDWNWLHPWGSHPKLDGLWSTEAVSIVHDFTGRDWVERLTAVAGDVNAVAGLHVCSLRPLGSANCGRCEPCLRTQLGLELAGSSSAAFERRPATWRIATAHSPHPPHQLAWRQLLKRARQQRHRGVERQVRRHRLLSIARAICGVLAREVAGTATIGSELYHDLR
jgi:hypothetical protein